MEIYTNDEINQIAQNQLRNENAELRRQIERMSEQIGKLRGTLNRLSWEKGYAVGDVCRLEDGTLGVISCIMSDGLVSVMDGHGMFNSYSMQNIESTGEHLHGMNVMQEILLSGNFLNKMDAVTETI